jgi:hypothetical protein
MTTTAPPTAREPSCSQALPEVVTLVASMLRPLDRRIEAQAVATRVGRSPCDRRATVHDLAALRKPASRSRVTVAIARRRNFAPSSNRSKSSLNGDFGLNSPSRRGMCIRRMPCPWTARAAQNSRCIGVFGFAEPFVVFAEPMICLQIESFWA